MLRGLARSVNCTKAPATKGAEGRSTTHTLSFTDGSGIWAELTVAAAIGVCAARNR
ncbi:protein of unknown function [Pseudomonas mediterranea]